MKTPGMDKFSKRLDQIFDQGMPTKAQILDAYNKFASQSSATDKLIMGKMEELIEHIKTWRPNTLDWHDKKCQLEQELKELNDNN